MHTLDMFSFKGFYMIFKKQIHVALTLAVLSCGSTALQAAEHSKGSFQSGQSAAVSSDHKVTDYTLSSGLIRAIREMPTHVSDKARYVFNDEKQFDNYLTQTLLFGSATVLPTPPALAAVCLALLPAIKKHVLSARPEQAHGFDYSSSEGSHLDQQTNTTYADLSAPVLAVLTVAASRITYKIGTKIFSKIFSKTEDKKT